MYIHRSVYYFHCREIIIKLFINTYTIRVMFFSICLLPFNEALSLMICFSTFLFWVIVTGINLNQIKYWPWWICYTFHVVKLPMLYMPPCKLLTHSVKQQSDLICIVYWTRIYRIAVARHVSLLYILKARQARSRTLVAGGRQMPFSLIRCAGRNIANNAKKS